MHAKRSRSKVIVLASVLAVSLAAVAWGHGFSPGRGFLGPAGMFGGRPGGYGGSLVQQLVFPCRAGCFDAAKACGDAAETAAESCAAANCAAEITAAQTACQADRSSSDCQIAVTALKTCAQSCIDTARSAVSSCQTTLSSCLTTCGNT